MKRKTATHLAGGGVSIGAGVGYAALIPFPFGLSSILFNTLAPIAGYLGYEFGRWIGGFEYKPIMLFVFAVIVVPVALFGYDSLRHANPNTLNSLLIFISFSGAIFAVGTALGIIELKIENFVPN